METSDARGEARGDDDEIDDDDDGSGGDGGAGGPTTVRWSSVPAWQYSRLFLVSFLLFSGQIRRVSDRAGKGVFVKEREQGRGLRATYLCRTRRWWWWWWFYCKGRVTGRPRLFAIRIPRRRAPCFVPASIHRRTLLSVCSTCIDDLLLQPVFWR